MNRYWCVLAVALILQWFGVGSSCQASLREEFYRDRGRFVHGSRNFVGDIKGKSKFVMTLASDPKNPQKLRGSFYSAPSVAAVTERSELFGQRHGGRVSLDIGDWDFSPHSRGLLRKPAFQFEGELLQFVRTGAGRRVFRGEWLEGKSTRECEIHANEAGGQWNNVRVLGTFQNGTCTVDLRFPLLAGPTDDAAGRANRLVRTAVKRTIRQFKKECGNFYGDPRSLIRPYLKGDGRVLLSTSQLNSMQIAMYSAQVGHEVDSNLIFTTDAATGKRLKLSDLFVPGRNYLGELAKMCRRAILPRYGDPDESRSSIDWVKDGTSPEQANYKVWGLTPAGLLVIFEEYQIDCYAAGETHVLIPYSSLRGIMKPKWYKALAG